MVVTLLRSLIMALISAVIVLGGSHVALAQDTDTATESVVETPENPAVDDGFNWLDFGRGVQNCLMTAGAADLLNIFVDTGMPGCVDAAGNVVNFAGDKVMDVAQGAASGAIEEFALVIGNAGAGILKFALGWWITVSDVDGNVFQETVATITDYTLGLQIAALTLSIVLLGGRLALARSGAIRDTSEEGLKQLAKAALLAGAASSCIVLATITADSIANWFMDATVGSDPSQLVDAMVSIQIFGGPLGTGLLFIIGIVGTLGGLVLTFLMLLRTGVLVIMTAALPIAGAAGGTKVGSGAYEKMLAWTIAFVLVKPVGAFVIGTSAILFLKATPSATDPDMSAGFMSLTGVIMLAAAAFVLPALMRLIVPNVGALGGGGSGAAATATTVATGVQIGGMVAGGAAGGGGGAGAAGGGGAAGGSGGASGAQSAPANFGNAGGGGGGAAGSGGDGPAGNSSGSAGNGSPSGVGTALASRPGNGDDSEHRFNNGGFDEQ